MRKFALISKYRSADKIKENEVGGACGTQGRGEKNAQGFGEKAHMGKTPLGRPRRRWEDAIRMELGEIGWGCRVDSVGSG
jgi:hypothetical protein